MTAHPDVRVLLADRYRLEERIAVGGMGEVWRATDVVLDRAVAVKTLKPEYVGDTDSRDRFRAEARHAGGLSHPGIASVYDFGELPEGAWLVMELVDGEPLSTVLRRERALPADRVLDVVAQTASALQAAHDGGVVHRDVKPGNLLVRPDGVVKVTDFGIASAAGAVPLTRTGQLVGTALYLSPEQASGTGAGPPSDLYSLGVVAYECLSGARPFQGEHPVAVVLAHLHDPPPPLPASVPAPVAALVLRLLAKDPAERPASAGALAEEATSLRGRLGEGPDALLPVSPPAAARAEQATAATDSFDAATGLMALPRSRRTGSRVRTGADRSSQRWAVRAIAVLLAVLGVGLGLRTSLAGSIRVPALPAGASEAQAVAALQAAGLTGGREEQSSPTVPAGQVIGLRPGSGTEVAEDSEVTVVVSTGPPPVTVTAASLVGKPAGAVRDALATQGLVARLAYDGKGQPVGTVGSVEPVGALPVGSTVLLHVVPEPPAPVVVPAPQPREPVAEPAPAAPPAEDAEDDKGGKNDDKGGKGKGK